MKKGIDYVDHRFFIDKDLSEEQILQWFDLCDAAWVHDGNPQKPHAELTSGKCSNGFFDCNRVLKYPRFNKILAFHIARKLRTNGLIKANVDWVIGSPYAGITISYDVADFFNAIHAFPEKDPSDPKGKKMIWRRLVIPKGAKVLQIEELITTSGTFQEVRRAVEEGNSEPIEFLPEIGVLVHRPPKLPADYNNRKVIALLEKEVWAVEPDECPLCRAGSKRLKPKANWAELTGKIQKNNVAGFKSAAFFLPSQPNELFNMFFI